MVTCSKHRDYQVHWMQRVKSLLPAHFYLLVCVNMSSEPPKHLAITYNEVHKSIRASAEKIRAEFNPDVLIAIGVPPFLA